MSDQTKYTQKLNGQRALIIGGSSGIGYAVAEALIEHGVTVIISSSNPSRVESSVSSLKQAYPSAVGRISGQVCNLGDSSTLETNISTLFSTVTDKGEKKLDHVIYTAADSLATMPVAEITLDKISSAALLRVYAPLLVGKHASQNLNPGPRSSITFTTGSIAEKPIPQWSVVGTLGTAITGMTRGLALDLKPIRVNCIAPGVVDTALWPEDFKKQHFPEMEKGILTGKVGKVEDVAEAYLYVIKDCNVNGSMISTNGGALLT